MISEPAAERWRALRRAGLMSILLGAWCAYALGVPAASGVAALKAAFAKKEAAKPSSASVSWEKKKRPAVGAKLRP
jgi:hypothetical protein